MKENLTLMLEFESNLEFCNKELKEVVDMFDFDMNEDYKIKHIFSSSENKVVNTVVINGKALAYGNLVGTFSSELERKRIYKRYAKLSIYKGISYVLGCELPWGSLTGIRPTKLAYQQLEKEGEFRDFFINVMKVSKEKTDLVESVLNAQKGIYTTDERYTDFFVFIPFCPSRCKYCSFITHDIRTSKKYEEQYVDALIKEINQSKKLIKTLRSIYVGGGTPVCLTDENLDKVLTALDDINCGVEYTVEAGRPDRITKENLAILKKHNVTRLCINPQTFNDVTLEKIGRRHTSKQIIDCFNMAKDDFIINMDLIAGLDGESVADFIDSVRTAINLKPQNITIHTLSVKHGSFLCDQVKRLDKGEVEQMISTAEKMLVESGYKPYYLYRQKYMAGNLENVGYALKGTECVYNVDVMEETVDNVACGAGAISKKVTRIGEEKIIRVPAPKDVKTYIDKVDKIILEKENTFLN